MQINAHEQFSASQPLNPVGDTASRRIDMGPAAPDETERPFIHVMTSSPLRSTRSSLLQVALLHSADGQHFTYAAALVEQTPVLPGMPRLLVLDRLPKALQQHLALLYRVTGDPLKAGSVTAFLSLDDGLQRGPTGSASRFQYYPSGIASSLNQTPRPN
jgi:hypothetical protein